VTSDYHGSAVAFQNTVFKAQKESADLLVICGDITHFGSLQEAGKLISTLSVLHLPVFFVPGNCDPPSFADASFGGLRSIHGTCQTYGNIMLMGIGGGPISPFNTPFEMTEEEIMVLLKQTAKNWLDRRFLILVSHSPPRNTRLDITSRGKHVGSSSLRQFIEEKKPRMVFCGHVHEAMGIDRIGETILVNPGPARHEHCAIADLNESVQLRLSRLG